MLDLCPKDLWHYHEMAARVRNERLREDLHVAIAAALLAAGDGKAAQQMDRSLAPPVEAVAGARAEEPARTEAPSKPTAEMLAIAEQSRADALRMWGV